jgi:hypothetical protein
MQPNHSESFAHRREDVFDRRSQRSLDVPVVSRSASNAQRLRSEGKLERVLALDRIFCIMNDLLLHSSTMYSLRFYTDSWIEISSQPSSSSLSSGGDHEIVTTGLQVQQKIDARRKRRRRVHGPALTGMRHQRPSSTAGSSQDEYEDSESESDKILSSSNEELDSREKVPHIIATLERAAEEEDDNLTAIGTGTADNNVFTPQPNAFSHPPSSQGNRSTSGSTATPDSYFPATSASASIPSSTRLSANPTIAPRHIQSSRPRLSQAQSSPRTSSHSPYNAMAPSHNYHPDHDAALRASLSTLLSCAAAVRGSPKQQEHLTQPASNRPVGTSSQPTTFRLVPGSHFVDDSEPSTRPSLPTRHPRAPASGSSSSPPSSPKQAATAKRKAREQSKDRHAKKSRSAVRSGPSVDDAIISPTLMTWMISAGVVIVFSAISFSAGYAWGKEIGRFEGAAGLGAEGASCGREVMRSGTGLRRLRWTAGTTSVTA